MNEIVLFSLIQQSSSNLSIWSLIMHAGLVVKLVMIILIGFSVYSIAIAWERRRFFKQVQQQNQEFHQHFWNSREDLEEVNRNAMRYPHSSLSQIFIGAMDELRNVQPDRKSGNYRLSLSGLDNIYATVRSETAKQRRQLNQRLLFLATTASATPFIGLFGTVWGIMTSFQSIGAAGGANLAVVAPGIAEALIATAFGLLAAIPAVITYNYLSGKVRDFTTEMEQFITDVLNIFRREYLKD